MEDKVPDTWRGVKVSDKALGTSPLPPVPIIGEDVGEVTDNIKRVMCLPPKTAVFNPIKLEQIELEVDKARVKARWHERSEEERNLAGESVEEAHEKDRVDSQIILDKKINLNNIRVTNLPGNKEVILPDDRLEQTEAGLAGFKEEMMEVARMYKKEKCDEKGDIKEAKVNREVEAGIKELRSQTKSKNQIYGKTDKSDLPFLVTEEEYLDIAKPHIAKDIIINETKAKKMENALNCQAFQLCRIFGLCNSQNCSRRLKSTLTNSNTKPPNLTFQIKDHKTPRPGEPKAARGLVGAGTGSFGREAGHIITTILDAIADTIAKEQGTELKSTEDLLAGINILNRREDLEDLVFWSSDAVALYPSLQPDRSGAIVRKLLQQSGLEVSGVNWEEAVLYLSLTLPRQDTRRKDLGDLLPRWKKEGTATCDQPGITTAEVKGPLQEDQKDWTKSLFYRPSKTPTKQEQMEIMGMVLEQAIVSIMANSCYLFRGEIRQHSSGLATGEDISRAVARVVMLDWDKQVTELAEYNNLQLYYHGRYVDDAEEAGKALAPGTRWQEGPWSGGLGKLVVVQELVENDLNIPADNRTMQEFVKMGSSINPDIQLTGDCPSLNPTNMMPALDIQLWMEGGKVRHQHFRKAMSNNLVMMECSAQPIKTKRTTLTQEGIRILKNTSLELPWEVAASHLSNLSNRMKASGYSEVFRLQIIKSAVDGFNKMVEVERKGGRPLNRPRSWEEDCRQKQKHQKKRSWFSKGGYHVPVFVPHTPGSELAKLMRRKEEENNQGRKIRFLIVELGGTKIHHLLWKPNPWAGDKCGLNDCFPCMGDKGGDCRKQGVTYSINCNTCQEERNTRNVVAAYQGETGRNAYDRGKEHLACLRKRSEQSVLWLHSLYHHQGRENVHYSMVVNGKFKEPLDRQLNEKVNICRFKGDILMNRKSELGGAVVQREKYKYSRWGAGGTR